MRSFLYAATVLALFAAGLANVMHETGGLAPCSAASASLGASAPLQGMIERALCEESAAAPKKKWVTAWTASAQGPYPSGFALLQPDLSLAFPDPGRGADDQSFRMIVRPDLWGGEARIRLSNAFGLKPVRFDRVYYRPSFRELCRRRRLKPSRHFRRQGLGRDPARTGRLERRGGLAVCA